MDEDAYTLFSVLAQLRVLRSQPSRSWSLTRLLRRRQSQAQVYGCLLSGAGEVCFLPFTLQGEKYLTEEQKYPDFIYS